MRFMTCIWFFMGDEQALFIDDYVLDRREHQAWACSWPVINTLQLFQPWRCLHLTMPYSFIKHGTAAPFNLLCCCHLRLTIATAPWLLILCYLPLQPLIFRCSFAAGLCNFSMVRSTDRHTCVKRWRRLKYRSLLHALGREHGMGRGMSFLVMPCSAATSCSAVAAYSSTVHVLQGLGLTLDL